LQAALIGTYIDGVCRSGWEVYGKIDGAESFPDWYERLHAVAGREAEDADEVLAAEFGDLTDAAMDIFGEND
jgi:CRISPR-associated protein Csc2